MFRKVFLMPYTEHHKVRFLDTGRHTRTEISPAAAIAFVGKLDKGDFISVTLVTEQPVDLSQDLATVGLPAETYKITFLAEGVRTRTFDDASDAAVFIGKLPPGKFLELVKVTEEVQAAPHVISRIRTSPGQPALVPLPQFQVPSGG